MDRNKFKFLRSVFLVSLFQFITLSAVYSQNTENPNIPNKSSSFIENKGQWDGSALYLSKLNGLNAWVVKDGLVFDFFKQLPPTNPKEQHNFSPSFDPDKTNQIVEGHVVKLAFKNALSNQPEFKADDKLEGYYNYFLGNDPGKWASYVNLFKSVFVKEIYKGIDVRYYFQDNQIRFDLIVKPHADPNDIVIKLDGQQDFKINPDNEIVLKTSLGEVKISQLITYQVINNEKIIIESRFKKLGNSIIFDFGNYNPDYSLIIDPLVYSTFIGGNGSETPYCLVLDQNVAVYIPGATNSSNYPTTTGAYQTSYSNASYDCFISKLNASGSNLVFSTYLGGNGLDYGIGLTLHNNGLFLTGRTFSSNFPTTSGAFQTSISGQDDAFLTKLDTNGASLIFSTYIGGSLNDVGHNVKIDSHGNPVVIGQTASSNFPKTSTAFQTTIGGGGDAFIAKFNPSGSSLIFSSFLGGSSNDDCWDFKIAANDYIYAAGFTESSNFPTTTSAYQRTSGGSTDIFVVKCNPTGSNLLYSTFVGGSGDDVALGIVLDNNSNAYCIGNSTSTNFPVTSGVLQSTKNSGGDDVVIIKIDSSGSSLLKSTYLGGNNLDYGRGIDMDSYGNIYLTGSTLSTNFPVTSCAFQTSKSGGYDRYITKINPGFSSILYSTYIGGSSNDNTQHDNIKTKNQYCFITGETFSSNFPTTSGSYQPSFSGGSSDGFVLKLDLTVYYTLTINSINPFPSPYCAGSPLSISYSAPCSYNSGNVFTAQLSDSSGSFASPKNIGTLSSTTSGTINGFIPENTSWGLQYRIRVVASNPSVTGTNNGSGLQIFSKPKAKFTENDSTQCLRSNNFIFANTSTVTPGSMTYAWLFGDGGSSTLTSPSHTYSTTNTFQARLIATSVFACKDTAYHTMQTYAMPIASFAVNDSSQCLNNNSYVFTNSSSSATSYLWNFGDGVTSIQTSPTHSYSIANNYIATLVATSSNSCKDSMSKRIYIRPKPTVNYTINDNTQCFKQNSFVFTNTSTISSGTMTYLWRFGDGGTSIQTNTSHTYAATGNFSVKLLVTSNYGCKDSNTKTASVYVMPKANFSVNDTTQCLKGNNFIFTNSSTLSSGTMTYQWNFGDAGTSTSTSPSHTYTTAGTYTVRLVSTSNNLCRDTIIKKVYVYPSPTVNYSVNDSTQCLRGNNFVYTNTSTITSGTMAYLWTFGDGVISALANPSHAYTTANTFNIKLRATSNLGCSDSVTKKAYVYPMPSTNFTINDSIQCFKGNNFVFSNTSSIPSGTITYKWTFGDGGNSTLTSPTHAYTSVNNFNVKLVSTSGFGCGDSVTKRTYVYASPTVGYSVNDSTQCLRGNNFVFSNSSSIGSGTLTYLWTFGDGGTSALTNPSHVYTTANTFNVKLKATSNLGCSDSVTKKAYVYPMPSTNFTINDSTQCFKGNNFVFSNASSIPSGSITYKWTYGDGGNSTLTSPTHAYTSVNNFNVKLVSTSGFGCGDSVTKRTYVYASPIVGYSVNDSTQCLRGNNFVFSNSSSIGSGTLTYLWTFGDGGTSALTNPSHVYTTANTFNVKLKATSNMGCSDSVTKRAFVYPMPIITYAINDSTQCLKGNNFVFNNTSTISSGTMSYIWTFGDGGTSALKSPNRTYATFATYNVKLIATSNNGCSDSLSKRTYVYPDPAANFTVNDSTQCLRGNIFAFSNTSTIGAGSMTYFWEFDDTTNTTTTNPIHSFTTNNQYSIKLTATSDKGCVDSIRKTQIVYPQPKARFVNFDSSQCLERNSFAFLNDSKIASGSMTYLWKFGDGDTSIAYDPVHDYAGPGYFTVTIIATSDHGCIDSFQKRTHIHVHPEPLSQFSVNDTTQCLSGNNFIFTNNSTIASGTFAQRWEFADGDTTNTIDATHTYITADTFRAKLLLVSDWGCKDSILKTIIVYPMPVPAFNINDSAQCFSGNSFTFTDGSSISSGLWLNKWNFGDGTSSTTLSPTHIYISDGTYIVKLLAKSGLGCADSLSKTVYVYPQPIADFAFQNGDAQCLLTNSFRLDNKTTVSSGSFGSFWDFGDGSTSILTNPSHSFLTVDTFKIKLKVTTSFGCADSIRKQAVLYVMPIADFSMNDSSQCFAGNEFIYTNKSIIAGNSYLKWYFGDGDSSAYLKPAHIYRTVDSFAVTLVVKSQKGCKDTMIRSAFTRPMPTASFTVNDSTQCLSGNSFNFSNGSTISKGNLGAEWNFGDGNTSKAKDTVYSYLNEGTFNVRMIINSEYSCSDTAFKKMIVYPMPVASFSVNDTGQCFKENKFFFTNSSYISTGGLAYNWNLGDGATTIMRNTMHSYLTFDTFLVKLVTTSPLGCTDSMSKNVYTFAMPSATFTINDTSQCLKGNSFVFNNSSTIGAGRFDNNWNFGDGDTSMSINPVHSYTYSDSFKVVLLLKSEQGCTDKTSKMVWVNPMPKAAFLIIDSSQCLTGNIFDYVNGSTIKSGVLSYNWDLGDATTLILLDITHSYATADTYAIKLVVKSDLGCFDSISRNVYIRPQPSAGFTTVDSIQCFRGNSFNFTNGSGISTGTLTYAWDFGDGNTSPATDPQHSYGVADSFEVSLISYSDYNCTDIVKRKVYIDPSPVADFSIDKTPQYLPFNKFYFTNKSVVSSGINNYVWDFGDGNASFAPDPDHTYNSADSFEVMLIANSDKGCADTIRKFVYVMTASIIADFTVSNVCKGDTVFFQNSSQIINDTFQIFAWDFGDLTGTGNNPNPYHIYKDTGTYTVTMIAKSKNGYKDTISHKIIVLSGPQLTVTKDTTIYRGQKVTLTANGTFNQVLWSTGDQTSGIDVDTQGLYSVMVTDINGCKSYDSVRVVVLERKKFAFMTVITPNGDGINDLWKIDDIKQYQPCKLAIYNRWGDELYSDHNYNNDWDGTYKGKSLPEGTYYFVLETVDHKVYKGAINILR